MRIWFKDGIEDQLAVLRAQEESLRDPMQVKTCRISGRNYIDTYMDFLDPTTEVPDRLLAELIKKVTVKDHRICRGFRTDGVYQYEGAELVATTKERVHSSIMDAYIGTKIEREVWQNISVSAPNIEALRAIYSQFRQGKLEPTENWEINSRVIEPNEPTEFDEEVPTTVKPKKGVYGIDF